MLHPSSSSPIPQIDPKSRTDPIYTASLSLAFFQPNPPKLTPPEGTNESSN